MSLAALALFISILFGGVQTDEIRVQDSLTECQEAVMSGGNAENTKDCGVDLVYGF